MIERTQERFDIKPERLAGDTAYGSGANLNWLVKDKDIAPHIPVIDKSKREDGTFSREDFRFDKDRNVYICPANKILTTTGKLVNDRETLLYRTKRATVVVACSRHNAVEEGVRPQNPAQHLRGNSPDAARALAKTEAFKQSSRDRKRVEMLFAHLKRILRLGRLRLRGPCGARFRVHVGSDCAEPSQACQVGRPATTVRPFVRCVSVASVSKVERKSPAQSSG